MRSELEIRNFIKQCDAGDVCPMANEPQSSLCYECSNASALQWALGRKADWEILRDIKADQEEI